MRRKPPVLTRRDFLRGTAEVTLAAMIGAPLIAHGAAESQGRSRVVLVRHSDALDPYHVPNGPVIQQMLDDGVKALTKTTDVHEAWSRLIRPDDLVGLKTNVWAYLPTPKEVEDAIRSRVIACGVPPDDIRVDDRGARKSLAGRTALINVRPLRTHHWAGIGGCLKNYIVFVNLPFRYHPNACADLGGIWNLPIVKGKTRLNILLALRPLFHGRGPHHFSPEYLWDYKGILLSHDPVAVDAVGVRLLSAKRRGYFGSDTPFPQLTHHVVYADVKHHVGVSDPQRIDLVKVGWEEDILI